MPPVTFDTEAAFTAAFPAAALGANGGRWRFDDDGSTPSGDTGPGTNNDLNYMHTETSGSGTDAERQQNGIAVFTDVPDGAGRKLRLRLCIQGAFGDGTEGMRVQARTAPDAAWLTLPSGGFIHGWDYSDTYETGDTITDENGETRTVVADGGWIDVTVPIPDGAQVEVRLYPAYINTGSAFLHDIAFREYEWTLAPTPPPDPEPTVTDYGVTISGQPVAVAAKSLRVVDHILAAGKIQCALRDRPGQASPGFDHPVVFFSGGTKIFEGKVIKCDDQVTTGQTTCRLRAEDAMRDLQHVTLAENYDGKTLKQILTDIVAQVPGLTLSPDQAEGPRFDKLRANYKNALEFVLAVGDVTRLLAAGPYVPYMLPGGVFRMITLGEVDAPAQLVDDPKIHVGAVTLETDGSRYYNEVTVISTPVISEGLYEELQPDGSTRTFEVSKLISEVRFITTKTEQQTVAERDSEQASSADWIYTKYDTKINQNPNQPTLSASDNLLVLYYTETPVIATATNPPEVDLRGKKARTISEPGLTQEEAADLARIELAKVEALRTVVHFQSFTTGWKPGQRLVVDLSDPTVSGTGTIEHVEYRDFTGTRAMAFVRAVMDA